MLLLYFSSGFIAWHLDKNILFPTAKKFPIIRKTPWIGEIESIPRIRGKISGDLGCHVTRQKHRVLLQHACKIPASLPDTGSCAKLASANVKFGCGFCFGRSRENFASRVGQKRDQPLQLVLKLSACPLLRRYVQHNLRSMVLKYPLHVTISVSRYLN